MGRLHKTTSENVDIPLLTSVRYDTNSEILENRVDRCRGNGRLFEDL